MLKHAIAILICTLAFTEFSSAQNAELVRLGELKYVKYSDQLPENLTSSRSAVIISVAPDSGRFIRRANWKKLTETLHQNFRKVGVDPITYIYQDDLNAGPEVREAYRQLFEQRRVRNLIHVMKNKHGYSMLVTPFRPEGFIQHGQQAWKESAGDLDLVILRLGRQILRQEMERSNFLIPEHPEYLDDLVVFKGTRMETYPSRLRSLPLAVVAFQKASIEGIENAEVLKQLEDYNQQVVKDNEELKRIMRTYPYKYEIVEETDENKLYDRGFQYALMPISSSGKFIKNILNYKTNPSETIYVANVYGLDSTRTLRKMPVDANVTKYYIKQTIVKDLHTGEEWDADVSWQQALHNFIFNLRIAFN